MTQKVKNAIKRQKSPRRHLLRAAAFCTRFLMMILVLGACLYGIRALWSTAIGDPRFRMQGDTLTMAGALRECPEAVPELEAIGRRFHGRSLLDPTLIGDLEKAYGENRWIRKVTYLRRRFPNRVDLQFLLRLPAAQVWRDNRYWLVDDEAALLPVDGRDTLFASLPEIVGVSPDVIGPRPRVGEMWRDEGVDGALGIIRAFWGSPLGEAFPVRKVVVNLGPRGKAPDAGLGVKRRFEVVSSQGLVVRWGTYNGGDVDGELTSSQKLWNLQDLLSRNESRTPGVCFDVRTRLPGYTLIQ